MRSRRLPFVLLAAMLISLPVLAAPFRVDGRALLEKARARLAEGDAARAGQIENYLALLDAVSRSPTITLPESFKSDFDRLMAKSDELTTDRLVTLVGTAVGTLIGKTAGGLVAGLLKPTRTSPCADLPSCTAAVDKECAMRFVADTEPPMFKKFVGQSGCAQRLMDALK